MWYKGRQIPKGKNLCQRIHLEGWENLLFRLFERKARAYLTKEKPGEIAPFLEDILEETVVSSGWAKTMKRLDNYFEQRWGNDWVKSDPQFFQNFNTTIGRIRL